MARPRAVRTDQPRYIALAIRSLERFEALTGPVETGVREAVQQSETFPVGTELIAEGEPQDRPRILLSGWAAKVRTLRDGRRQIVTFLVPGDLFGIAWRYGALSPCGTIALTQVNVSALPWQNGASNGERAEAIVSQALRLEESRILDQVVRTGRQTAYERTAHLLLEIHQRLKSVLLVQGGTFLFPLTQEVLADALGLSVVHTNRTLQQLRRDGLIETKGAAITLLQPDRLAEVADFRMAADVS